MKKTKEKLNHPIMEAQDQQRQLLKAESEKIKNEYQNKIYQLQDTITLKITEYRKYLWEQYKRKKHELNAVHNLTLKISQFDLDINDGMNEIRNYYYHNQKIIQRWDYIQANRNNSRILIPVKEFNDTRIVLENRIDKARIGWIYCNEVEKLDNDFFGNIIKNYKHNDAESTKWSNETAKKCQSQIDHLTKRHLFYCYKNPFEKNKKSCTFVQTWINQKLDIEQQTKINLKKKRKI